MKVARKAPAIPSTVVRRKPLGSFGPGESTRAIRPAMKPITMIQMMFDTSTSLDYDLSLPPTSSVATLAGRRATVVQTPTANPIVAAVPRGVVTTHCRSWGHATDAKKSALLGGLGNVLADLAQLALEGRCIARRACDRRNDGLQNLTSAEAADGAGDGVAGNSQIVGLQCCAGGFPSDDA